MRRTFTSFIAIVLAAAPAQAADWNQHGSGIRSGAFIGARVKVPLGGSTHSATRAGLTVAPTQSRIARDGYIATRIGEGVALDFAHRRPLVTLAGVPASRALGLEARNGAKVDDRLGISTGGWIAIGVGTVAVAGLVGFALWVDAVEDSSD